VLTWLFDIIPRYNLFIQFLLGQIHGNSFATLPVRYLDASLPGRFATWTVRYLDGLPPGRFATGTFRTLDVSIPGRFVTSLDVSPPDDKD